MKKIFYSLVLVITLLFSCPMASSAQVYYYHTTEMSYKYLNKFGRWMGWTPWEPAEFLIVMNFDGDMIKVFSPDEQTYKIKEYVKKIEDRAGGRQIELKIEDQDNDNGIMRLRMDPEGGTQVYVEFKNLKWVYKVEEQTERYVGKQRKRK